MTAASSGSTAFPDLILYGHPVSGHSYKVALFLTLADLEYRYRDIDIFAPGDTRGSSFRTVSRFNEVPVLVAGDDAICQSNAILIWLAARFQRFGGTTPEEITTISEWLFWEMSRLSLGVANLRFLLKFDPAPAAELVRHYRMRSVSALETLDDALQSKEFMAGNRLTIADLSCSGYLFWLHEAQIDIDGYPGIKRWLGRISALPRWQPPAALLRDAVTP